LEFERHAMTGPHSARVDHVDKSDVPHNVIEHNSFFVR
jgi:hypothetical protein